MPNPTRRYAALTFIIAAVSATTLVVALARHPGVALSHGESTCVPETNKVAAPGRVTLGETVRVTLTMTATCATEPSPVDVMLVIDQSDSMRNERKMENARAAALAFLDAVPLDPSRVGVVGFNHQAGLFSELTTDRRRLESAIDRLMPGGQTNVSAAISLAHDHLMDERSTSRPAMVVLTDGYNTAPGAEPIPDAADRAKADGITIAAYCAGGDCDPELPAASTSPELYFDVPDTSELPGLYRELAGELQANAIAFLTIRDEIPGNMLYVSGSAVPPPTREGAGFLEWDFAGLPPPEGITYLLEPQQVGRHPTNVVATGRFRDRLGDEGGADFPVPYVVVVTSPECRPEPLEVMFLIDDSNCLYGQSLMAGDPRQTMDARSAIKLSIADVLDQMNLAADRAAVIGFGSRAVTFQTLTSDRELILDAVDRVAMRDPWARLDLGFQAVAREMETDRHDPDANVVTVIVTDGPMMQTPADAEAWAAALRTMGVRHYAIGVGFVTQHATLRAVAEPGGYYEIPFGGDVMTPYHEIGTTITNLGEKCAPEPAPTPTPWQPPVGDIGTAYLPRAHAR